jgi:hypothetical protein
VHLRGGLEPVAPADGRHAQVQPGVLGMSTDIHHILGSFAPHADLHQLLLIGMTLAEVNAQPALTIVDSFHLNPPRTGWQHSRMETVSIPRRENGSDSRTLSQHEHTGGAAFQAARENRWGGLSGCS